MPVYEFVCDVCDKKSSVFVRSAGMTISPACSFCGGKEMTRVMSSFAMGRSASSGVDDLSRVPNKPNMDYYSDPRNIGKWTEKRANELGFELPAEIKENIEKARSGKLPDDVQELGKVF